MNKVTEIALDCLKRYPQSNWFENAEITLIHQLIHSIHKIEKKKGEEF